jgi:hypothetical protein
MVREEAIVVAAALADALTREIHAECRNEDQADVREVREADARTLGLLHRGPDGSPQCDTRPPRGPGQLALGFADRQDDVDAEPVQCLEQEGGGRLRIHAEVGGDDGTGARRSMRTPQGVAEMIRHDGGQRPGLILPVGGIEVLPGCSQVRPQPGLAGPSLQRSVRISTGKGVCITGWSRHSTIVRTDPAIPAPLCSVVP